MSNVFSCVARLGKDASTRTAGSTTVTGFSVANNVGYGEREQTLWLDCQLWGKRGEAVAQYLTKGKEVFVSGELSTREHEGKTYMQLNCNVVDFVGGKSDNQGGGQQPAPVADGQDVPF